MHIDNRDIQQLSSEHQVLLMQYARIQLRCTEQLRERVAEIDALRSQAMRQQAAIIRRDTALAWEREDRAAMEAAIPGLPRRWALAQRVRALSERLRELMRERTRWQLGGVNALSGVSEEGRAPASNLVRSAVSPEVPLKALTDVWMDELSDEATEQAPSFAAADRVICQTGCLSHGAYWRIEDHCKRTGKTCMLAEQPASRGIVRFAEPAARDRDDIVEEKWEPSV